MDKLTLSNRPNLITPEQEFLLALLYDVGEDYLTRPQTAHNEAIINATSLLIDLLEAQQ